MLTSNAASAERWPCRLVQVDSKRAEARGRDPDRLAKRRRERVFIASIVYVWLGLWKASGRGKELGSSGISAAAGFPLTRAETLPGDL